MGSGAVDGAGPGAGGRETRDETRIGSLSAPDKKRKEKKRKLNLPPPLTILHSQTVTRQGLFGLGLPEIAVIAGVAALIFGPSKLPSIGKELGKTVKSFQTAAKEFESELKSAASEEEEEAGKKKE